MIQISFGSQHRKEHINRQRQPLLPFDFCLLPFPSAYCLLAFCLLSLSVVRCFAQEPKPYAAINHDAINYNGPGRDARHDLAASEIRLGLLAPLAGPRQAEGEALRRGAEMAIEEENSTSLPGGRRLALVTRDESGPWGQASAQIVRMVFDDQAVALITSAEGGSAHLAEQVGTKIGVPILALSSDTTTTEINLPWIFRLGPTDTAQAQAFASDIYENRKLQRVVLLSQDDRDGRLGSEEFTKAARAMNAVTPTRIVVDPEKLTEETTGKEFATAQAVILWTDAATANLLVPRLREVLPSAPVYLCHKAAQGDGSAPSPPRCRVCSSADAGIWTTAEPEARTVPHAAFARRYMLRFGAEPGIGAAEAYDAVRVLAASLRQSGPNRVRLRDALAGVSAFAGASGIISFDHAGNDTSKAILLKLK
jgi:branched-chain amino acid transport system substrate-binding protein